MGQAVCFSFTGAKNSPPMDSSTGKHPLFLLISGGNVLQELRHPSKMGTEIDFRIKGWWTEDRRDMSAQNRKIRRAQCFGISTFIRQMAVFY